MQLRRLAALERQKIEDEHKEVLAEIAYLEDLLANPDKILALIKDDMAELVETYGDERRTSIDPMGSSDLNEEDLVKDEAVLISITERGYVKRVSAKTFRAQGRGGRGVKGHETKDQDEVLLMLPARTLDTVLFFSDRGKVYSQKAYRLPDAGRTASGTPIVNILALGPSETITAAVTVPDFKEANFCTMATRTGRIKRVSLAEFESVRPSGLIAINLAEEDELGWVRLTNGENEVILVTEKGQALRYSEEQVRAMGRTAAGVIGIRIRGDDRITSMEVVEPGGDLLVVSTKGIGKRSPLEEYTPKGRGTMGVKTTDHNALDKIGRIASARVVQEADDLTIISSNGVVIRTKVKDIKRAGRATRGVNIMNLDEGDTVATLARMAAADLKQVEAEAEKAPEPKQENGTGQENGTSE